MNRPHPRPRTPRLALAAAAVLSVLLSGCQAPWAPLAVAPATGTPDAPAASPQGEPVPAGSVLRQPPATPTPTSPAAPASATAAPTGTPQAATLPATSPAGTPSAVPAATTPRPTTPAAPKASTTPSPAPAVPGVPAERLRWAAASYSPYRGPNRSDRVVLSYDDCPTSLAAFRRMVLDTEAQGVALALFPLGTCLQSGRFDADFARAHGHYVFNHTVDHGQLSKMSVEDAIAELGAPGVQTTWGRPPYGDAAGAARAAYRARGMRIWLWTVDTNDWRGPKPAAEIVRIAVTDAKPGGTVLMHMQHSAFTPEAVAQIRSGLAGRGLGVCRNTGPTKRSPLTIDC